MELDFPLLLPHTSSTFRSRKNDVGWWGDLKSPLCFDQIILGVGFLQLFWCSNHFFPYGLPPPLLKLRWKVRIKGKPSNIWRNLWTLELCLFGQDLLIVAPPTSYFHGDHSHISPQISADQSRHLETMEFQASCASFTRGYWSSSFPLVLPNDLFCRPSKRDFVGLVSLRCVKFLWCLW